MRVRTIPSVVIVIALLGLDIGRLSAEESLRPLERPDSSEVTVPSVDTVSEDRYFYFHKAGISYDRAFSDLDECRMFSLEAHLNPAVPKFVPLGFQRVESEFEVSPEFGIQHGVIGGLVAEALAETVVASATDELADSTNRRCMMYKGYSRYGTTRATWKQISTGTDTQRLARLALIASGPQPVAGRIGP